LPFIFDFNARNMFLVSDTTTDPAYLYSVSLYPLNIDPKHLLSYNFWPTEKTWLLKQLMHLIQNFHGFDTIFYISSLLKEKQNYKVYYCQARISFLLAIGQFMVAQIKLNPIKKYFTMNVFSIIWLE